jgi:hypothetical protein
MSLVRFFLFEERLLAQLASKFTNLFVRLACVLFQDRAPISFADSLEQFIFDLDVAHVKGSFDDHTRNDAVGQDRLINMLVLMTASETGRTLDLHFLLARAKEELFACAQFTWNPDSSARVAETADAIARPVFDVNVRN